MGGGTKAPSLPQTPNFSFQQDRAAPQEHIAGGHCWSVREARDSPWAVLQPWGSRSCSDVPQGHHPLPEFEQGMDRQGSRGLGPPRWGWVSLHFTDGKYQGSTLSYKERSYCEKMLSEEQKQTVYSCLD